MEKLVSIVIPVYNVEEYLTQCLESVISQTYKTLQIIIVNDGSTDKSGDICRLFAEKDSRIELYHKYNAGLSAARNLGLQKCKGDYVYFLDSDDYLDLSAIEKLIAQSLLYKIEPDVVFFEAETFFDPANKSESLIRYTKAKKYDSMDGKAMLIKLTKNGEYSTSVPLLFIKRAYLDSLHLLFHEGIIYEDIYFSFAVFYCARYVSHVHEALYYRRVRPNSIMTTKYTARNFCGMFETLNDFLHSSLVNFEDVISEHTLKSVLCDYTKRAIHFYALLNRNDRIKYKPQYKEFRQNIKNWDYLNNTKIKLLMMNRILTQTLLKLKNYEENRCRQKKL